ncbi:hypothetical protein ACFE04_029568 [Oxalis oulophora]
MKIIFNLLLLVLVRNSTWSSEVEEEVNNNNNNNNNNNELKIDGKVLELDDSNFDTDLHLRYPPQSVFSIVVSKWCFLDRLRLDRMGRLQDSNAVLSHFNDFSENCFAELSAHFATNTRPLKSIKSDLDYIFLKLRYFTDSICVYDQWTAAPISGL